MMTALAFAWEFISVESMEEEADVSLDNCGVAFYEEYDLLEESFSGDNVKTLREVFCTFEGFLFHYRSCEAGAVQVQGALIALMRAFNCAMGRAKGFPEAAVPQIIESVVRTLRGMIPDVSRTRGAAIDMFDGLDCFIGLLEAGMGPASDRICMA
jgi:hypothetical protein